MRIPDRCKIKCLILISLIGFMYLLSQVSYFFVSFDQPLTADEYINFLKDNGIDPKYHKVYVLRTALISFESIGGIDGMDTSKKIIEHTVFYTEPYAIRALFDKRVRSWRLAGPENPCD